MVIDIENICNNRIEKVSIVRDNDHCPLMSLQLIFKPSNCLYILIVGRFIEEENIRFWIENLCKKHFKFVSRVKRTHKLIVLLSRNPNIFKNFCDVYIILISRVLFHADSLKFCKTIIDSIIFKITRHINLFFLFNSIIETLVSIQNSIHNSIIFKSILILS
ncbi:hypothetical protein MNB_SM-5-780 [hydrothermal vent metagenome]|uniref:Uncharacterized protein n=1 Tax=hydrothermal vent metagenome TaxID=652676 RepID=A0A1W1CB41_9ZZZZ